MESAFGDHRAQAQPRNRAADNRESDNSEHQSGSGDQHSMCQQGAPESASPSIKVESAEGAGETGGPWIFLHSCTMIRWHSIGRERLSVDNDLRRVDLPEVLLVILLCASMLVDLFQAL